MYFSIQNQMACFPNLEALLLTSFVTSKVTICVLGSGFVVRSLKSRYHL